MTEEARETQRKRLDRAMKVRLAITPKQLAAYLRTFDDLYLDMAAELVEKSRRNAACMSCASSSKA